MQSNYAVRITLELARDQTRQKYKLTLSRRDSDKSTWFFLDEAELDGLAQAIVDLSSIKYKLDDLDISSIKRFV